MRQAAFIEVLRVCVGCHGVATPSTPSDLQERHTARRNYESAGQGGPAARLQIDSKGRTHRHVLPQVCTANYGNFN